MSIWIGAENNIAHATTSLFDTGTDLKLIQKNGMPTFGLNQRPESMDTSLYVAFEEPLEILSKIRLHIQIRDQNWTKLYTMIYKLTMYVLFGAIFTDKNNFASYQKIRKVPLVTQQASFKSNRNVWLPVNGALSF